MTAYYNEIEPFAVAWLRELIKRGLIADGVVDDRPIEVVGPADLAGHTQCHFFAGIGVWSYALRLAGWPDDRLVWTGSCPCQPYSAAGKGEGGNDPRHLWPAWFRLIRECRPVVVFGEQVEAAIRHGWLDALSADVEGEGYAVGSAVFGAHSVGAPHRRQRLYFVAESCGEGAWWHSGAATAALRSGASEGNPDRQHQADGPVASSAARAVADYNGQGCDRLASSRLHGRRAGAGGDEPAQGVADESRWHDVDGCGADGFLADTNEGRRRMHGCSAGARWQGGVAHAEQRLGNGGVADTDVSEQGRRQLGLHAEDGSRDGTPRLSEWSDAEWLPCADGKARPVEPGTFPLAHGAPARVGRLRGYGNAIVAPQAAAFIEAYLDVRGAA